MGVQKSPIDAVHWYIQKQALRIVASSGIPTDQFHLGKMIQHCLREAPDFTLQIDGATGETETCGSVLKRSIQCAVSLKNLGLNVGDNIILMAPNHLDLAIPFYAALYLGLGVGCIDIGLSIGELEGIFQCEMPKVIFCQNKKALDVTNALKRLDSDAHIITFDDSDKYCKFAQFIDNNMEQSIDNFRANDFDPDTTTAFLISTSGTTGLAKAAVITHANLAIAAPYWWLKYPTFPTPTRLTLLTSSIQWITNVIIMTMSPILQFTRLQSSLPLTVEHAYHLINVYKPTDMKINPNLLTALMNPNYRDNCDFSSLELIMIGGSAVPQSLIDDVKGVHPEVEVCTGYGMSEISGLSHINFNCVPNSCGQPLNCVEVKVVNVETSQDVTKPNTPGELWVKGPTLFKGYYNNKELTEQTLSEDGWLKTGDIFYRDENWNFFFVDRIKMLLKYKSYQISPVEIEDIIQMHPDVLTVAVTGIPHPDGELPVACIVPHEGCEVKEDEIKNIVKESLSDWKQLRGGVIFMKELPLTASSKVNRAKLKEIVLEILKSSQ